LASWQVSKLASWQVMRIENFWEIGAWKEAKELTKEIYKATRKHDFAKDYGLAKQIQRSTVSVMANIAEGFGRKSNKEFAQFLIVGRGSNVELQSHLFVAQDLGYISEGEFKDFFERSKNVEKAINAFITYLRNC
jgi:four helix bundle protein